MTEKKYIDASAWLEQCSKSYMHYNLAKKIIAEAPAAPVFGRWIDAAEQPPTEPDEYIVMIAGETGSTVLHFDVDDEGKGVWFEEVEDSTNFYKVTHWMPLPEAPGEDTRTVEDACPYKGGKKTNVCKCKACGAEIAWITMQSGKKMPCDAGAGHYRVDPKGEATFVTENGLTLRGTPDFDGDTVGYVSHFQTCPQAEKFRKRGQGDE